MASTHPYRQAYPSLPLSQHSSVSPEHPNRMISYDQQQQQQQQQYHHQPHPLRPLNRPYQVNRQTASQTSLNRSPPNDDKLRSQSISPAKNYNPYNRISSPTQHNVRIPAPPFTHGHHSSVSSIESSQKLQAPDTPQGIRPINEDINDSLASSPMLLSTKLSLKTSPYGSTQSLPKPTELNLSHARSGSTLSIIQSPNFTSYNDYSHTIIAQQLGNNSNSLLPKLKTIELYRLNAKKSHDPEVLFQYAKYMLNTAIFINVDIDNFESTSGSSLSLGSHKKNKSTVSLMGNLNLDKSEDFPEDPTLEEKKTMKRRFLKEALHYLKKLSDKGFTEAQYLLADAYSSGAVGKPDDKEAFLLFQAAAKHGHVESAYRTSFCYEVGLGTGRDSRKALEFLKFAATKNHPSAMYKMGLYSFYGRMGLSDTTTTKKDGIKWLKRASENANELIAAAPYELGKIHYEGFKDIIIQDKVYALELYRLAASLGHIQSAAILGKHYELGDIIPQDPELSIHYYTQASLGGDAESMLGLCGWFMVGATNLEKNEHELFEWALKAANIGLPKAQFATGHFLEKGIGCEKNQDAAMLWFQKAAEKGDERAIKKLKGTKFEKADVKKGWVNRIFK